MQGESLLDASGKTAAVLAEEWATVRESMLGSKVHSKTYLPITFVTRSCMLSSHLSHPLYRLAAQTVSVCRLQKTVDLRLCSKTCACHQHIPTV